MKFVGPWTVYLCIVHCEKINKCGLKKKKQKEENAENENTDTQTLKPNGYYMYNFLKIEIQL